MKNYSKMSDFEVNLAVTHILLGKGNYDWDSEFKEVYLDMYMGDKFDPCNNPSDAYPIIYSNGISIGIYGYGEWGASTVNHQFVDGVNPLRAAMIVYLMMKDSAKC